MGAEQIIIAQLGCIIFLLVVLCVLQIEKIRMACRALVLAIVTLINRMFYGALYYLSWLFPRQKNLVLFTSDEGRGFSGNPKYLFKEALKYPQLHPVWITKSPKVLKSLKQRGYEAYMCYSRQGILKQLQAKTIIHSNSIKEEFCYWAVAGATSVNCWHGVGLKRVWFRNTKAFSGMWAAAAPSLRRSYHLWWAHTNLARENYVIGTSEEVNSYYPATYHVKADHVLNLGQARNDVLFCDELEEDALPRALRNKKIIVYMPTYREYGKDTEEMEIVGQNIDYKKLSEVLKKYGYTFVIKQHRFNTPKYSRNHYDNIVDISATNYEFDTQVLLKHTSILITDYSSAYTDYLLLDKPVVFYCYDIEEYLNEWEINFDYDYVTPGPKVFTSDELIEALEKLMQGQDEYKAERERVKRVFYSPENQKPVAQKQMKYIVDHIINKG